MSDLVAKPTLQSLPFEVLINIFKNLDERDLYNLQRLSKAFYSLVDDEELWKNLFLAKFHAINFPSYSLSRQFSVEYLERCRVLRKWRNNKAIKTRYVLQNGVPGLFKQLDMDPVVFNYPKCACYQDGTITLIQLQSKRRRTRLTYIPCTTPEGCLNMDFNINAAVFGRLDGRVFGKLLTNKSYLQPVTEFNHRHQAPVTAIKTALNAELSQDWCVSGSKDGELIWWCEGKLVKSLKLTEDAISHISFSKQLTIAVTKNEILVIRNMTEVHRTPVASNSQTGTYFHHYVDFGSMNIVLVEPRAVTVTSLNVDHDFGYSRTISTDSDIIKASVDEETMRRPRDRMLAGEDACYISLVCTGKKVYLLDIRSPGPELKFQTVIKFDENVFQSAVTNLIVACTLSCSVEIYDIVSGELIKKVLKTERYPSIVKISQGKMITGNTEVLHYLQFLSEDSMTKKYGTGQNRARGNKWKETLDTELEMYDEEETRTREQARENERLLNIYGGDIGSGDDLDEEQVQLQIAMMESQAQQQGITHGQPMDEEEALQLAMEESRLMAQQDHDEEAVANYFEDEDDDEFLRALELSRAQSRPSRRPRQNSPLQDAAEEVAPQTARVVDRTERDEDLELAIALSLSEVNEN